MKPNLPPRKFNHGLVFGKFMPLHEGHLAMIRFAQASCERLTILVCSLPSEPIPGQLRYEWMKESFPNATVVHHDVVIPQYPEEHPDFWQIWRDSIRHFSPETDFDALFGSENYGWRMAKELGIEYIPVNRARTLIPVSGTAVRENPMKQWDYIPSVAKPYFVKRIRIVGPESTGKSTLVQLLAKQFSTVYVEEYARPLLDEYVAHRNYAPGEVRPEDIVTIARGQIASEEALARFANRVLFCDTDLFTTVYWSKFYFQSCPPWIEEEANQRSYALTLLLAPDVPWVADAQRPMPDLTKRQAHFDWWQQHLLDRQEPFVVIRGEKWADRLEQAVTAVNSLGVTSPFVASPLPISS